MFRIILICICCVQFLLIIIINEQNRNLHKSLGTYADIHIFSTNCEHNTIIQMTQEKVVTAGCVKQQIHNIRGK